MKIAVLLTCFNRKALTMSCLEHVLKARDAYNVCHDEKVYLSFFITDDKCTDGTPEVIGTVLRDEKFTVISADGNAYWAGGMRLAWQKALEENSFDFYLLLNDDTDVWTNLFDELLDAHSYSLKNFSISGIYSGNTTQKGDKTKITFGGKKENGSLWKKYTRLKPNGVPQLCDIVNANILLVSHQVVEVIGIFPNCYIHSAADNDYAKSAAAKGFSVMITSNYCGSCDADNYDVNAECEKIRNMSLRDRKKYFKHPVRSIHDTLEFYKKWRRIHVPLVIVSHFLHIYMPLLYSYIYNHLKK